MQSYENYRKCQYFQQKDIFLIYHYIYLNKNLQIRIIMIIFAHKTKTIQFVKIYFLSFLYESNYGKYKMGILPTIS